MFLLLYTLSVRYVSNDNIFQSYYFFLVITWKYFHFTFHEEATTPKFRLYVPVHGYIYLFQIIIIIIIIINNVFFSRNLPSIHHYLFTISIFSNGTNINIQEKLFITFLSFFFFLFLLIPIIIILYNI